eukprot:scaffold206331_cov19-Tisochrysis_lutea.AAC.1
MANKPICVYLGKQIFIGLKKSRNKKPSKRSAYNEGGHANIGHWADHKHVTALQTIRMFDIRYKLPQPNRYLHASPYMMRPNPKRTTSRPPSSSAGHAVQVWGAAATAAVSARALWMACTASCFRPSLQSHSTGERRLCSRRLIDTAPQAPACLSYLFCCMQGPIWPW